MIYDTMARIDQYKGISPRLDTALEVLKKLDFTQLKPGKYPVSEGVYFNVMESQLRPYEQTKWECHRQYIDIQHALEDGEQIAACPLEQVTQWSQYSEEGDSCVSQEDVPCVALPTEIGNFAIFFPGDAHRPCWATAEGKKIKKVVIKVRV